MARKRGEQRERQRVYAYRRSTSSIGCAAVVMKALLTSSPIAPSRLAVMLNNLLYFQLSLLKMVRSNNSSIEEIYISASSDSNGTDESDIPVHRSINSTHQNNARNDVIDISSDTPQLGSSKLSRSFDSDESYDDHNHVFKFRLTRSQAKPGQPLYIPVHMRDLRLRLGQPNLTVNDDHSGITSDWEIIWNFHRNNQCHFGNSWYQYCAKHKPAEGDIITFVFDMYEQDYCIVTHDKIN